jgi:hypothetical protein
MALAFAPQPFPKKTATPESEPSTFALLSLVSVSKSKPGRITGST